MSEKKLGLLDAPAIIADARAKIDALVDGVEWAVGSLSRLEAAAARLEKMVKR